MKHEYKINKTYFFLETLHDNNLNLRSDHSTL